MACKAINNYQFAWFLFASFIVCFLRRNKYEKIYDFNNQVIGYFFKC